MFKVDTEGAKGFLGKLQAMGQQLGNLRSLTSEPLELEDETQALARLDKGAEAVRVAVEMARLKERMNEER